MPQDGSARRCGGAGRGAAARSDSDQTDGTPGGKSLSGSDLDDGFATTTAGAPGPKSAPNAGDGTSKWGSMGGSAASSLALGSLSSCTPEDELRIVLSACATEEQRARLRRHFGDYEAKQRELERLQKRIAMLEKRNKDIIGIVESDSLTVRPVVKATLSQRGRASVHDTAAAHPAADSVANGVSSAEPSSSRKLRSHHAQGTARVGSLEWVVWLAVQLLESHSPGARQALAALGIAHDTTDTSSALLNLDGWWTPFPQLPPRLLTEQGGCSATSTVAQVKSGTTEEFVIGAVTLALQQHAAEMPDNELTMRLVLECLTGSPCVSLDGIWPSMCPYSPESYAALERFHQHGYPMVLFARAASGSVAGLPLASGFRIAGFRPRSAQVTPACGDSENLLGVCSLPRLSDEQAADFSTTTTAASAASAAASAIAHRGVCANGCHSPTTASGESSVSWMALRDAVSRFSGGCVLFLHGGWRDCRVRGAFTRATPSHALEVSMSRPTRVFVTLHQPLRPSSSTSSVPKPIDERERDPSTGAAVPAWEPMTLLVTHSIKQKQFFVGSCAACELDVPVAHEHRYSLSGPSTGMALRMDPQHSPYYIVPHLQPRAMGNATVPYVAGLLAPPAEPGDSDAPLRVAFKQFPPAAEVFVSIREFSMKAANACVPVAGEFQIRTPCGGLTSGRGFGVTL